LEKQGCRLIEILSWDLPWEAGANSEILRPETAEVQAKINWESAAYKAVLSKLSGREFPQEKK